MRMPFGMYQGEEVDDLPDDYITWLQNTFEEIREPLKTAIEKTLTDRATLSRANRVCNKCEQATRKDTYCAANVDGVLRFFHYCPACKCVAGGVEIPWNIIRKVEEMTELPIVSL